MVFCEIIAVSKINLVSVPRTLLDNGIPNLMGNPIQSAQGTCKGTAWTDCAFVAYKDLASNVIRMLSLHREGSWRDGDVFRLQAQERGLHLPGGAGRRRDERRLNAA